MYCLQTPIQLSKIIKTLNFRVLNLESPLIQHLKLKRLSLVEVNGFEPMTSCVQGRRSPS
jgi:hypothetical protein